MRDHDPRPPGLRAPDGNSTAGRFYLVGGVTVVLVLVVGLLFSNPTSEPSERTDQARPTDRAIETPARP